MRFYLDLYLGRTDGGAVVHGTPHVWDVRTNWKFAADNFTGDNFHLYTAHGSVVELGMLPPDPMSLSYGHLVNAEGGHVLHVVPGPARTPCSRTSGCRPSSRRTSTATWTRASASSCAATRGAWARCSRTCRSCRS
jgi:phenylpropionate dioxygenase-like ring-hydroxylating dioxygenase large terminal subunit